MKQRLDYIKVIIKNGINNNLDDETIRNGINDFIEYVKSTGNEIEATFLKKIVKMIPNFRDFDLNKIAYDYIHRYLEKKYDYEFYLTESITSLADIAKENISRSKKLSKIEKQIDKMLPYSSYERSLLEDLVDDVTDADDINEEVIYESLINNMAETLVEEREEELEEKERRKREKAENKKRNKEAASSYNSAFVSNTGRGTYADYQKQWGEYNQQCCGRNRVSFESYLKSCERSYDSSTCGRFR